MTNLSNYKELENNGVRHGLVLKKDSIIAEGSPPRGIIYSESGSFFMAHLRADGEWGRGRLFRGPSLMGLAKGPQTSAYFVWALEPCIPQIFDSEVINQTDLYSKIAEAQTNDRRHLALLAAALTGKKQPKDRVSAIFSFLTENGKIPTPVTLKQPRIALLAGISRQHMNKAIKQLEKDGQIVKEGTSRNYRYWFKGEIDLDREASKFSQLDEAELLMRVEALQSKFIEEKLAYWLSYQIDRAQDPLPKITKSKLAFELNVGRSRLNETINHWIDRGLITVSRGSYHASETGIQAINSIKEGLEFSEIRKIVG